MAAVRSGRKQACKEEKQLMDWVEYKLNQPDKIVVIKNDEIEEAKLFIERYFPFKLYPAQLFVIACIVGLVYEDDMLVFNEFFLLWARGAGKNGFIAALSKYFIYKQHIRYYNVDIVAPSEKQAKTSFEDVRRVLESDKTRMKKHYRWTLEEIESKKNQSKLTYHTNNARTKDGLRPGAVIFDEVHEYETYDNIKVFTSALGKVKHGRRFYITTDGYVRGGVIDDFKEEARMILDGELPNSRMFPMICKVDNEEEVHDVTMWEKANPGINYLPELKNEMLGEYENIKVRPSSEMEFLTKRMNSPHMIKVNGVADWDKILEASQPLPLERLKGMECIGGIDYADTRDFVGVGLLFRIDGAYQWLHHSFINIRSLKMYDYKVDINLAVKQGLATIIHEETNKPEIIADWFAEQAKTYHIKKITSDMMRINHLREVFKEYGFSIDIARSGTKTHTLLEPIVDELFAYNQITWGNDFLMRWYTNNTYVKRDGKGNITYEKIEPQKRKTDGFFALLHALQFAEDIKKSAIISKGNVKRVIRSYSY